MVTRITAGAFLTYKDKILLMKRGLHKKLAPGLWTGIGGHIEIGDIKDTKALDLSETCYREVYEETGIIKSDIKDLELKYITVRKSEDEIRINYHYMGRVEKEILPPHCDEGELHWVDIDKIIDLSLSVSVREVLKHWRGNPDNSKIHVIIVGMDNKDVKITEL